MEEIKFNEEKVLTNMTDVTKALKTIKIVFNFIDIILENVIRRYNR